MAADIVCMFVRGSVLVRSSQQVLLLQVAQEHIPTDVDNSYAQYGDVIVHYLPPAVGYI